MANNLSVFSAFNPLNGYNAGAGSPNTDIYGNYYQGQVNAYNQSQQNAQANARGYADLALHGGGGTIASLWSDARIKENLRPVGQLFNGLTVYAFNFPDEETTRIGLVAQEVEKLMPEAVSENEEGLLMVNYGLATQSDDGSEESRQEAEPQAGAEARR
jgi:hypothetical protein